MRSIGRFAPPGEGTPGSAGALDPPVGQRVEVPPLAARTWHWLAGDPAADLAHWVSLVGAYIALSALLLNTWFHGDDFEFLANRVGRSPALGLWAAHVNHWSTAPILVWRALYAAFGVSSAAPYYAASLFMHVLAGHLLWRLMLRTGLAHWLATGLTATFLAMGAGWENITWAFQLGFLGSFALGLASILLCLRRTRSAFALALLLSLLALTFSGVGTVMAAASTLCLLLLRRYRGAIALAVCTGAAYVIWSVVERAQIHAPPHGLSLVGRMANAPGWTWRLLASAYGTYTAIVSLGGVFAVLLIVFAVWRASETGGTWARDTGDPERMRVVTWVSVTGAAAIQVLSFAVSRNDVSPPDASRYLYFVIALSLPLIGMLLRWLSRKTWQSVLVGLFVAYLILEQGLLLLAEERQFENPVIRAETRGLAFLISTGQPVYPLALGADLNTASITKWVREGALGRLDDVPPQDVLDARAIGLVQATTARPGTGDPADVMVAGAPGFLARHSCAVAPVRSGEIAASFTLRPGETVAVSLGTGGSVLYRVVEDATQSAVQKLRLGAFETRWLSASVPTHVELLAQPGNEVRVCVP